MKKLAAFTSLLAIALFAVPLQAGEEGHKCTAETQKCLDYLAAMKGKKGWLGIEYDEGKGGKSHVITKVVPGSPAEAAGIKPGDALVALNGIPMVPENEAKLKEASKAMTPGAGVTYQIRRDGEDKEVKVTLAEMPEEVYQRMVGAHMLEHAGTLAAHN